MTRVGIVDDNGPLRRLLVRLVQADEHLTVAWEAGDADAAAAHIGRGGADAVIVDLSLPDVDGVELLHRVSAATSDVRYYVLSGYLDARVRQRCADAGASACFEKGGDLRDILRLLRDGTEERP